MKKEKLSSFILTIVYDDHVKTIDYLAVIRSAVENMANAYMDTSMVREYRITEYKVLNHREYKCVRSYELNPKAKRWMPEDNKMLKRSK